MPEIKSNLNMSRKNKEGYGKEMLYKSLDSKKDLRKPKETYFNTIN